MAERPGSIGPTVAGSDEEVDEMSNSTGVFESWQKAFIAGDADAIGELYADDATLVLASMDIHAVGRPAIRDAWAGLIALAFLLRKPDHSVLDAWMQVVLTISLFEVALAAMLNSGRFDIGFYAGRLYGFLASSLVLYLVLHDYVSVQSHLKMSEQVARILESITDAFLAVDREWRLTYVNREAEENWGN